MIALLASCPDTARLLSECHVDLLMCAAQAAELRSGLATQTLLLCAEVQANNSRLKLHAERALIPVLPQEPVDVEHYAYQQKLLVAGMTVARVQDGLLPLSIIIVIIVYISPLTCAHSWPAWPAVRAVPARHAQSKGMATIANLSTQAYRPRGRAAVLVSQRQITHC